MWIVLEQPAQSWGFKFPAVQSLWQSANMFRTCTWMAFFGADMHKPTHLLGNLQTLGLKRTMTTKDRLKYKARLQRRNLRRVQPKVYYTKCLKADGSQGWSGGKHLAESAAYTSWFCRAVMKCWVKALEELTDENV